MKFISLLACLTATAVLAAPFRSESANDQPVGDIPYPFLLKAYGTRDGASREDPIPVGVSDFSPSSPLGIDYEFNTPWTLRGGVLSPLQAPYFKVTVSPMMVFPPRAVLMPTEYGSIEGYRVQAVKKDGKIIVSIAEPLASRLGSFGAPSFHPRQPLVYLPSAANSIELVAEEWRPGFDSYWSPSSKFSKVATKDRGVSMQCSLE